MLVPRGFTLKEGKAISSNLFQVAEDKMKLRFRDQNRV
jgi:hypothetical protein